jgi:hypothetical protein
MVRQHRNTHLSGKGNLMRIPHIYSFERQQQLSFLQSLCAKGFELKLSWLRPGPSRASGVIESIPFPTGLQGLIITRSACDGLLLNLCFKAAQTDPADDVVPWPDLDSITTNFYR